MRNLILGSSGFLGRNLVKELIKSDCALRLFDIKINKDNSYQNHDIECIQGEFNLNCNFDKLTEGIDTVYHLISTTIPSSKIKYDVEIEQNVICTIKLLDSCVKNKVKKVVFISSGGTVYGKSNGVPFREDDTTNPICSYGIQKITIEKYLQLYYHMYGLDYRIVRLANPYGPGQNPNGILGAVTTFTYKLIKDEPITIYGDGNVIRDYIYINDAISDIIDITKYEGEYKLFNIGSGKGYSLNEIVRTIEEVVGKKFSITCKEARNVDVPYNVLDISRLKTVLPEKHTTSLSEGVGLLSKYFISNF